MIRPDVRRVLASDKQSLATLIADELIELLTVATADGRRAHVVLTGGSMGVALMEALPAASTTGEVLWPQVHFWWGDERFVPDGSDERNDTPALPVLRRLGVPDGNIHRVAPSGGPIGDLESAAADYAAALGRHAESVTNGLSEDQPAPAFDVLMLGVGPDGHVASLFPAHPAQTVTGSSTVAVDDSPKPPPQRVSLTFPVLNQAKRVWLTVAGADKADAVARAVDGDENPWECPASAVHGTTETVWWLDDAAAAKLSD